MALAQRYLILGLWIWAVHGDAFFNSSLSTSNYGNSSTSLTYATASEATLPVAASSTRSNKSKVSTARNASSNLDKAWTSRSKSPNSSLAHLTSSAPSNTNSTTITSGVSLSNTSRLASNYSLTYHFAGIGKSATKCNEEWKSYSSVLEANGTYDYITSIYATNVTVTNLWGKNRSVTTLCDGHGRYLEPLYQTLTVDPYNETVRSWGVIPPSFATAPACKVRNADCRQLTTSFVSAWSAREAWTSTSDAVRSSASERYDAEDEFWKSWDQWPLSSLPDCTKPNPRLVDSCGGGYCKVEAHNLRLMYFPVNVVGGLCNQTTITATPTIPGKPNTIAIDGTTYTSGFVYVSISKMWASSGGVEYKQKPCGPTLSNVILTVRSSDVFSANSMRRVLTSYPFNFADLNFPQFPPFSVYEHKHSKNCDPALACDAPRKNNDTVYLSECLRDNAEWCSTFMPDSEGTAGYNPYVLLPTQITDVHPAWTTCVPHFRGVFDPPVALTPMPDLGVDARPTTNAISALAPPAMPAQTAGSPGPAPTSNPGINIPDNQQTSHSPGHGSAVDPGSDPSHINRPHAQDPGQGSAYDLGADDRNGLGPIPSTGSGENQQGQRPSNSNAPAAAEGAVFSIGDQRVTAFAQNGGNFIVGTQTLGREATITMGGILASAVGDHVVIGGLTVQAANIPSSGLVFDVGGSPKTLKMQDGKFILGSQTITPGTVATIGGVQVNVDSQGYLVVGGTTQRPSNQDSTTSSTSKVDPLNTYIVSGIGGGAKGNIDKSSKKENSARSLRFEGVLLIMGVLLIVFPLY